MALNNLKFGYLIISRLCSLNLSFISLEVLPIYKRLLIICLEIEHISLTKARKLGKINLNP